MRIHVQALPRYAGIAVVATWMATGAPADEPLAGQLPPLGSLTQSEEPASSFEPKPEGVPRPAGLLLLGGTLIVAAYLARRYARGGSPRPDEPS
jgi:hypothetical protein